MGFENVGRVWTPESLADYLSEVDPPAWCSAVTFHHTAVPSLEQRPLGFRLQNIKNAEHYYRNVKGWSSGPHLFVDEDQCWGMCPFTQRGVHARVFNAKAIGIEVLGNYGKESPDHGRGLSCWRTATAAGLVLLRWLNKEPSNETVLLHRDNGKNKKLCPGRGVDKSWILSLMET